MITACSILDGFSPLINGCQASGGTQDLLTGGFVDPLGLFAVGVKPAISLPRPSSLEALSEAIYYLLSELPTTNIRLRGVFNRLGIPWAPIQNLGGWPYTTKTGDLEYAFQFAALLDNEDNAMELANDEKEHFIYDFSRKKDLPVILLATSDAQAVSESIRVTA